MTKSRYYAVTNDLHPLSIRLHTATSLAGAHSMVRDLCYQWNLARFRADSRRDIEADYHPPTADALTDGQYFEHFPLLRIVPVESTEFQVVELEVPE